MATPDKKTEENIREAARLIRCFYSPTSDNLAKEKGISEAEIRTGGHLASLLRSQDEFLNRNYGRPEYGTRSIPATVLQDMIFAQERLLSGHDPDWTPPTKDELWERITQNLLQTTGCPF